MGGKYATVWGDGGLVAPPIRVLDAEECGRCTSEEKAADTELLERLDKVEIVRARSYGFPPLVRLEMAE